MPMYINKLYMYTIIVLCKFKKKHINLLMYKLSSMKILAKCLCLLFYLGL